MSNSFEKSKEIRAYQRNTRHNQRSKESTEHRLLSTVLHRGPTEHIEVRGTKHVPRVKLASLGVNHVVIHEHLIPGGNEVDVNVESDLKISVHSKETC